MESNQSNGTVCWVRDLVLGDIGTRKAWKSMMARADKEKSYRCKPDMGLDIEPLNVKQDTKLWSLGK